MKNQDQNKEGGFTNDEIYLPSKFKRHTSIYFILKNYSNPVLIVKKRAYKLVFLLIIFILFLKYSLLKKDFY